MIDLITATAIFAAASSIAPTTPQDYAPPIEYCMKVYEAAQVTMELRQMGDSRYELLKIAPNDSLKIMVNDAYKVRIFDYEYLREKAADAFADEYFNRCLDGDF